MLLKFFRPVILALLSIVTSFAQDGTQDVLFNPGTNITDGEVRSIGILSTGEVIAVGAFVQWDGNTVNRIVKLGTDGSIDFGFLGNMGPGADNTINDVAIMSDDRIVVGGAFQNISGNPRDRIAIINPDGSLDANFDPLGGFSDEVLSVELEADEQILVGGYFTQFNAIDVGAIARLQQNGNLDGTFGSIGAGASGAFPAVWDIEVQADDHILIGGEFDQYNGNASTNLARLDPDGNFDPSFSVGSGVTGGAFPTVFDIALNSSEAIIIGGEFTQYNGFSAPNIAMIDPSGGVVPTFASGGGTDAGIRSIDIASDDYIIAGGTFANFAGNPAEFLVKITPSGVYEGTFNTTPGADGGVEAVKINDNTSLYIGGAFQNYQSSNLANRIAKINNSVMAPLVTRLYVDLNAAGLNNGTTWVDAFNTIQDALSVANYGDSIWVAQGTYFPSYISDNTEYLSMISGVKIFGGFASGDNFADRDSTRLTKITILSGEIQGDADSTNNSNRIFENINVDNQALLDGFILELAFLTTGQGGAIHNNNGDAPVRNCTFRNNTSIGASRGPATYNENGSTATYSYCDFDNNYHNSNASGGLLAHFSSNSRYSYCNFTNNRVSANSLIITFSSTVNFDHCHWENNNSGSGSSAGVEQGFNALGNFSHCSFINNTSSTGAIRVTNNSLGTTKITNCYFEGNISNINGAAIWIQNRPVQISNCVYYNNSTANSGGAIYGYDASIDIYSSTFYGNQCGTNGGALSLNNSGITNLYNSIVWGNIPDQVRISGSTFTTSSSIIEGGGYGSTNIDPLFVDPSNGDLRLDICSPAIDRGDNDLVHTDVNDVDEDLDLTELHPLDSDNNIRFVDIAGAVDLGTAGSSGIPQIIDLGAYESFIPFNTQMISVSLGGSLLSSSSNVSLAQNQTKTTDTTWVVLENTGDCDLIFSGASLVVGSEYTLGSWTPPTLASGQRDSIPVIYNAVNSGSYNDTLLINSNDPNDPVFTIFFDRTSVSSFITTWQSDNPGISGNNQITIPTSLSETYLYDIIWEEIGNVGNNGTINGNTGDVVITFPTAGNYRVYITGTYPRFWYTGSVDQQKLLTIEQWGDISWVSMEQAFLNMSNLHVNAVDAPDLSGVTSLASMFWNASAMNEPLDHWDVSTITDMSRMFQGCTAFNQPLNSWNVSNVQDMSSMFSTTTNFNSNITGWNVSNVTNMTRMFENTPVFNQDISGWNVGNVQTMDYMFWDADNFNRDLPLWDVSNVTAMQFMFGINTGFNGNISTWNTERVKNMASMFNGATNFNQDLSSWSVDSVLDFSYMFANTLNFNSDLSLWDVGMGINMEHMFQNTLNFNSDISGWDVTNVTNMNSMFQSAPSFDQNLGNWNVSNVNDFNLMFQLVGLSDNNYDSTLIGWNNLGTLQSGMTLDAPTQQYCRATAARENIINTYVWTINDAGRNCTNISFNTTWQTDNPGTSTNTQITIPTLSTATYNYDIYWEEVGVPLNNGILAGQTGDATINVPSVGTYRVEITGLFPQILFANFGDKDKLLSIEQWGQNPWTSFTNAFMGCSNLVINATDVPDLSGVSSFASAFRLTTSLSDNGGAMGAWNMSGISSTRAMFQTSGMNRDLSSWDVSNITNMSFMFASGSAFNQDISMWDVSEVDNLDNMFFGNTVFDQDISGWDVDSVTDFTNMFRNATAFNQDLSSWDLSGVTSTIGMFSGASSFNQNLGNWDISMLTNMSGMLDNSGLSIDNYDSTLIGWNSSTIQSGVTLGADGLNYCNANLEHTNLSTTHSWTINDAGQLCPCDPLVVTNTTDAGCGSLREAITTANASSGETITFNIPGVGPHVISPTTSLPDITSPVIIDGYSQPGASANTLATGNDANIQIEIDGINVNDNGIDIVNTSNSTIQGLSIYNFDNYGIRITGAGSTNNFILGNFVGIRSDGITAPSATRQRGIQINGAQGNYIGNGTAAGRNIASGNGRSSPGGGIDINGTGADSNYVLGNYCGTDASGLVAVPNQAIGIELRNGASANIIGGNNVLERNISSGNNIGINFNVLPNNNSVIGNYVGVGADGTTSIPNIAGIDFDGNSSNNQIGGPSIGEGNVIANNSGYAIRVESNSSQNTFSRNSIYLNTNGIILNPGTNADIAAPIISNITATDVSGYGVTGDLIDLYEDDQGSIPAQGSVFLGTTTVVDGKWTVGSLTLGGGEVLTAIATDPSGNSSEFGGFRDAPEIELYNGNTIAAPLMTNSVSSIDFGTIYTGTDSTRTFTIENIGTDLTLTIDSIEITGSSFQITNSITTIPNGSNSSFTISFSSLVSGSFSETVTIYNNDLDEGSFIFTVTGDIVDCDSLLVTNTLDDGSCGSLRAAITFANSTPGKDTITFNIPTPSPWTISVSTNLPTITEECIIDGTTQPGWAHNDLPTIRDLGPATRCINISADSVEVYGLRLTGFNTSSDYPIYSNAGTSGIIIGAPFKGNVINGSYHGILLQGPGAIIQGNKIGTDSSGTYAIQNEYGIRLNNCTNCLIGGPGLGEGNLISGNNVTGLRLLSTSYATVQGNFVGTDINGTYAIPNGSTGITLGFNSSLPADSNLIGGINPGEGNLISGNSSMGLRLLNAQGNEVYGNLIGTDINGTSIIENVNIGISLGFTGGFESNYNKIGGSSAGQKNVVVGGNTGISMNTGTGNIFYGNTLGLDINGDTVNHSGQYGVNISSNNGISQNIIGGFGTGQSNIISGYDRFGIRVDGDPGDPANENKAQGNIFYYNGDGGIILDGDANNNILPPIIDNYTTGFGATISGTCPSCSPGDSIDVYRDSTSSAKTQANEYLGSVVFSSNPWSLGGLTLNSGDRVTAHMTDNIGNTSAFFEPESEIELFLGSDTTGTNILDAQLLSVMIDSIDLGDSTDATFTIYNYGLEQLIIDTTYVFSGTSYFTIVDYPNDTLLPFESDTFVIRFYNAISGNYNGSIRIDNNDPDEGIFTFPIQGVIMEPEINAFIGNDNTGTSLFDGASNVSFGSDIQGNDITQTFAIENTGTGDLIISTITVTGSDFTINSSIDTIPAGVTDTFTVTLSGAIVNSFSEIVTINSNDQNESAFTFTVDGTITPGPEPEIDLYLGINNTGASIFNGQLGQVDFGSAQEGNDIKVNFAIENTGTADLNISGISVGGTDFSVLNSLATISVGITDTFSVTLSGISPGNFNDTISIFNDDSDENPFEFPITGIITPCNYLIVTGILDDGSCGSLQGAITTANATPGVDTITFTIGASAGSIDLQIDLPAITEAVVIDGSSSPLWSGKPVIDITSTVVSYGLDIQASGTRVNGLAFSDLNGVNNIIQINVDSVTIENCHFGVDTTGLISGSASVDAIQINTSTADTIRNNIFARSTNVALDMSGVTNSLIDHNIFGTSIQYDQVGSNWEPRVALALNTNCDNVTISNNVIASTFNEAIAHYDSKHSIISGNKFGADTTGSLNTGWGTSGSWLPMFNSDSCEIVDNVFLNATFNSIYLANSNYNKVKRNFFGVETDSLTTSSSHTSNNAIWVATSHSNQIGDLNPVDGNIITASNDGIRIESDSLNTMWSNIIYGCGGEGINVFTGAQEGIAPPIIYQTGDTVITGSSSPNAFIQFYADAENQGQYLIDTFSADPFGVWSYTFTTVQINNLIGLGMDSLTAIQDSLGNTSAFSQAIELYIKTPITWNNTNFTVLNGNIIDINLINSIDDPDGILDTNQIKILNGFTGGSTSSIDSLLGILNININQTLLLDSIQIEICDIFGDCYARYLQFNIIESGIDLPIVHNAISVSDQDGLNDKLIIEFIDQHPESKLRIFNKWNTNIADITNYDNDTNYWDAHFNGQPIADGTYYYVLWLNSSGSGKPYETGFIEVR